MKKIRRKSKLDLEREHAAFLARVGYTPKKRRLASTKPSVKQNTPFARPGSGVPCSNTICVITYKNKKVGVQKYTVAPAYNKGAYQLITKNNVKDIGK
jgi:hypothetical protein